MPTNPLKLQARRQAKKLGHKLEPFWNSGRLTGSDIAHCVQCDLSVSIHYGCLYGLILTERCTGEVK